MLMRNGSFLNYNGCMAIYIHSITLTITENSGRSSSSREKYVLNLSNYEITSTGCETKKFKLAEKKNSTTKKSKEKDNAHMKEVSMEWTFAGEKSRWWCDKIQLSYKITSSDDEKTIFFPCSSIYSPVKYSYKCGSTQFINNTVELNMTLYQIEFLEANSDTTFKFSPVQSCNLFVDMDIASSGIAIFITILVSLIAIHYMMDIKPVELMEKPNKILPNES